MEGWIKLHRKLAESIVFSNPISLKIWVWILLKASKKQRFVSIKVGAGYQQVELNPGEFLFGRFTAEEQLNIDGSTIYKHIHKLEDTGNITLKSNSHYTIITVCNWETYQDNEEIKEQPNDKQMTGKEQPNNTSVTPEEHKQESIIKYIEQRKFYEKQKQICLSNGKDEGYLNLIEYLFGKNELKEPIAHILKLEKQLEYYEYLKIKEKAKGLNKTVKDYLEIMVNTPKYAKGKKSLYLCLNQYTKNEERYRK